jgi:hypothetical protein
VKCVALLQQEARTIEPPPKKRLDLDRTTMRNFLASNEHI